MAGRANNPLPGVLATHTFFICIDVMLLNATYLWIPLSLQIENEFGPLEWDQGEPAKAYASWAANMAVALNTGVPWIMCKEDDAPDPIVCIVPPSIMHLGQHFLNVLGSDLVTTIVHHCPRKETNHVLNHLLFFLSLC